MKYLLLIIVLFTAGCSQDLIDIQTKDPRESIGLRAGTVIDWSGVPEKDRSDDMRLWSELMSQCDPNQSTRLVLTNNGVFFADKMLYEIRTANTEENLQKNWSEKIWDFITGKKE